MSAGVVVITGASGYIGRALARDFAERGWTVRAGVRNLARFSPPHPNVAPFACDMVHSVDVAAFGDAKAVVHAAWALSDADRANAHAIDVEGSRRIVRAARTAGVPHFVFVSSCSAHAAAESDYGRMKFEVENMLDFACDAAIRPGFVLGEGGGLFGRMVDVVRRSRVLPVFDGGRQPLQTILIDDLCACVRRVIELRAPGLFVACEDPPVPMARFLDRLARRVGPPPRFVSLPSGPMLPLLELARRLGLRLPVNAENLRGLRGMIRQDPASTVATLGTTFRPFEDSLDELEKRGYFRKVS